MFDGYLLRLMQWAYDYLLDRYGILIGTVRGVTSLIWFTAFAYWTESTWLVATLAAFIALGMLVFRAQNEAQKSGRYAELNAMAMEYETGALFVGLRVMLIIFIALDSVKLDFSSLALYIHWLTTTVKVRDRDESRFRELKLSHVGTR
jgi:hypothetical protein